MCLIFCIFEKNKTNKQAKLQQNKHESVCGFIFNYSLQEYDESIVLVFQNSVSVFQNSADRYVYQSKSSICTARACLREVCRWWHCAIGIGTRVDAVGARSPIPHVQDMTGHSTTSKSKNQLSWRNLGFFRQGRCPTGCTSRTALSHVLLIFSLSFQ